VAFEDDKRSGQPSTSIMTGNVEKKFENPSTKGVEEQSISSKTSLGSVMEFAGRS
jgi:hypothetical protein